MPVGQARSLVSPCRTAVREGLNYWRYLTPAFANAPKLRARGRRQAPAPVVWLSDLPLLRSRAGIRALTGVFRCLERAIPVRAAVRERVRPLSRRTCCWSRRSCTSGRGRWTTCAHARRPRHRQRARRRQLGSPHDQGLDPRAARPHRGVERAAAHRGGRAARRARRSRSSVTGRPGLRPLVRDDGPRPIARGVLRPGRAAGRSPVPALPLLVALHRALRGGRRAPLDRRRSAAAASPRCGPRGILVRPHPQNAAQWAGVDLSAFGDAVDLAARRREPDRPRRPQRVLRLDAPRARRRGREHQRAHRVGHRRAPGVLVPACRSSPARRKARCTSSTSSTAACCGWRRRSTSTSRSSRRRSRPPTHDRAARARVHPAVRAAPRARRAGHAARGAGDRGRSRAPSEPRAAAARPAAGAGAASRAGLARA